VWTISTGGWGYELWGAKTADSITTNGGWSGGANFAYSDGHAKFAKATKGGDVDQGDVSGLFSGYFPKAYTRKDITTDGTPCPTDRSSKVF
jgi:prepilin-type processing-associated H-X9-DG protein